MGRNALLGINGANFVKSIQRVAPVRISGLIHEMQGLRIAHTPREQFQRKASEIDRSDFRFIVRCQRRLAIAIPQPVADARPQPASAARSEEHTSELQSLMRISYAVFCLKNKKTRPKYT